jgi:hypothetical protein
MINQVKEDEMGREGTKHEWRRRRMHIGSIMVGKARRKESIGRRRRRWVDNIKIHLRRSGGMVWIDLARDRYRWRALYEHGNKPKGSIKCWEVLKPKGSIKC